MPGTCQVCFGSESKYKCPTCFLAYCSVACCQRHKETPCSRPLANLPTQQGQQPRRDFQDGEDEDGIRLRAGQLEKLAFDRDIRGTLADRRLQETIRRIDSAQDAEKALDEAMASPGFRAFSEQVLAAIGPADGGGC